MWKHTTSHAVLVCTVRQSTVLVGGLNHWRKVNSVDNLIAAVCMSSIYGISSSYYTVIKSSALHTTIEVAGGIMIYPLLTTDNEQMNQLPQNNNRVHHI